MIKRGRYGGCYMILVMEIGNSYITMGGYEQETLVFVSDFLSDPKRTRDQYFIDMKHVLELYGKNSAEFTGGILCSVVPELTEPIRQAVFQLFGFEILVVGPGVKSGLNILIDNPAQLGGDLVACAVGALAHYEAPLILCSLGTTTVLGVIDEKSRFVGAVISAGVGTTLDSFTKRTALLPHVPFACPAHVIGKNSVASIQSGLLYGTAAMIDGLILRIREELGMEVQTIATGKMTKRIIPLCHEPIKVHAYLLLEGLRLIYEKNQPFGV